MFLRYSLFRLQKTLRKEDIMKTLYIHIGCPKTATTSIQYFCNENKENLAKHGVYFPAFEQILPDINPFRNAHFLIAPQYG